jgi:hypothetical protein
MREHEPKRSIAEMRAAIVEADRRSAEATKAFDDLLQGVITEAGLDVESK